MSALSVIIGYGNDLRGDDAAGRVAADRLAALHLPRVQVLSVPQLVPELAAVLAQARVAIFIDADVSGCLSVRVTHLLPVLTWSAPYLHHTAAPEGLLALTAAVYGQAPDGWLIRLPAIDCSLGAPLSPLMHESIAEAVEIVKCLVTSCENPLEPEGTHDQ